MRLERLEESGGGIGHDTGTAAIAVSACSECWLGGPGILFVAVSNAALGEIVGGHLEGDAVSGKDADAVAPELAGQVGQDEPFGVKLDAKQAAGEFLHHGPGHFNAIFFTHLPPRFLRWGMGTMKGTHAPIVYPSERSSFRGQAAPPLKNHQC